MNYSSVQLAALIDDRVVSSDHLAKLLIDLSAASPDNARRIEGLFQGSPVHRVDRLIDRGPLSTRYGTTEWFDSQSDWAHSVVTLVSEALPQLTTREDWWNALCWASAMLDGHEELDDSFGYMQSAGLSIAGLYEEHASHIPSGLSYRIHDHLVTQKGCYWHSASDTKSLIEAFTDPTARFEQYAYNMPISDDGQTSDCADSADLFIEQCLHRLSTWLEHTVSSQPSPEDMLAAAVGLEAMLSRVPHRAPQTIEQVVELLSAHVSRLSDYEDAWKLVEAIRTASVEGVDTEMFAQRLLDCVPDDVADEWVDDYFGDEWFLDQEWF